MSNVLRCLRYQLADWGRLNSGGGPAKLWGVVDGAAGHLELYPLLWSRPWPLWVAYRRLPLARLALVAAPLALLPFGEQLVSGGDGFAVIYGLAAPYFALFAPAERRALVTTLLLWGYLPSLAARPRVGLHERRGLAADGRGAAAGGGALRRLPGALASPREGEPARLRRALPALGVACLAGMLAVTVVYEYQFLPRAVPTSQLTVTSTAARTPACAPRPQRAAYLAQLRADLARLTRPSDRLLISIRRPPSTCSGRTAWPPTRSGSRAAKGSTSTTTPDRCRRPRSPTTLVAARPARRRLRVVDTAGLTRRDTAGSLQRGLDYRVVLVRAQYAVFRRVPGGALAAAGAGS